MIWFDFTFCNRNSLFVSAYEKSFGLQWEESIVKRFFPNGYESQKHNLIPNKT